MRYALVVLAACSNAADPAVDAHVGPPDASTIDAPPDAPTDAPAGVPIRILVINEVVASGTPDWFEIVNATTAPVELSDFVYVDAAGDFMKARAFPAMTLGAGARYVQDVDDVTAGFKLAGDEELWVYRASDHALSDGVDWADGASPAGMSYARVPDVFGPFVTQTATRGTANLP